MKRWDLMETRKTRMVMNVDGSVDGSGDGLFERNML